MSKIAFITGASSGIGADIARELAGRGWRVGLFARRESELKELAAQIESAGGQALALPGDVTRQEDLDAAAQKIASHWGPVDLLVANAGVSASIKPTARAGKVAERCINVNVLGVIHSVDAVIESMAGRGSGHIVAVASLAGWKGLPGEGVYSASKAAVITYMESMRISLKKKGIRVSTVNPGFVDTPLTEKVKSPMPFKWDPGKAAKFIVDGIEASRAEINFPLPLVGVLKFARLLPNFAYDAVMSRFGGF